MKKFQWMFFGLLGLVVVGLSLFTRLTTQIHADSDNKVKICHSTSSNSNPYNAISPNKSGDVQGHDDHDGGVYPAVPWGDIIPPFNYGDGEFYPGKNWTEDGQAIWENECNIPNECVETTICPTACGYAGGSIEGKCGNIECKPTAQCPIEEKYIGVFVECVQPREGGYGAVFGYKNENEGSVELKKSYFTPSLSITPPSTLESGRHILSMIDVPFIGKLVWTIETPAGIRKTATASPSYTKVCKTPVDACPNIEGVQESIPEGMVKDDAGNCVEEKDDPDPTSTPIPTSIGGITRDFWSEAWCDGHITLHLKYQDNKVGFDDKPVRFTYANETKEVKTNKDGYARVDFDFKGESEAKVEFDGQSKTTNVVAAENCGDVLGVSTGQVLGASTMAATGTIASSLYSLAGIAGMALTAVGIKRYGKKN